MSISLARLLEGLTPPMKDGRLGHIRRGIEKEGLRVDAQARIAQTPHPAALGSKLTHPYITTDYSEALLEYVTPVFCKPQDALDFLADLHRFTYRQVQDEYVWPTSMPSVLAGEKSIPIADFGTSHTGTMKRVYRNGLEARYGRIMQSIAGIHYNVSLPEGLWTVLRTLEDAESVPLQDYRSARYFHLIRQFRRHSWLLMYLFGASSSVDKSFFPKAVPDLLSPQGARSLNAEYATTLRMSDMGYQNKVQGQQQICFNTLDNFINALQKATVTPWPDYERVGVKVGGEWRQLSANILQIENEYYSDVRPKRVTRRGQTPSQALRQEGVEYIEVRCLDINPLLPLGIDETQIRFLDVFLVWCLLSASPWIGEEECRHLDVNRARVALRGRDPALTVAVNGQEIPLAERAEEIVSALPPVAEWLDLGEEGEPHREAIEHLRPAIKDPTLTVSGQIASRVQTVGEDFAEWTLAQAKAHRDTLMQTSMDEAREAILDTWITRSFEEQRSIELQDTGSFDEYLARYFASASK